MIPKKIHYIWFGGNPLPPLAERCIASWENICQATRSFVGTNQTLILIAVIMFAKL